MRFFSLRVLVQRVTMHFDQPLLSLTMALMFIGFMTVFSATYDAQNKLLSQMLNMAVAFACMWTVAQVPPQKLMRFAIPLYVGGLILLVLVWLVGIKVNGARRWLNIGVGRIQPSEIMKIAVPLMLAWYYHHFESSIRFRHHVVAAILLLIPFLLIFKQPDLGTALLVGASGFFIRVSAQ
jgi:rod shape determining protein RodA